MSYHIRVWKWYSDNRLEKVLDIKYNGDWWYIFDFIKENLKVRKVGAFFVHIISEERRGKREFLIFFRDAEFDWGKERYFLQDDELEMIGKILGADTL